MIKIYNIRPEHVSSIWDEIEYWLDRAIQRTKGRTSLDIVKSAILTGNIGLWVLYDDDEPTGVVTTEIVTYPLRRVLTLPYVGGEGVEKWADKIDYFEKLAKDAGCEEVELYARPGWTKIYPEYKEAYRSLRKEI